MPAAANNFEVVHGNLIYSTRCSKLFSNQLSYLLNCMLMPLNSFLLHNEEKILALGNLGMAAIFVPQKIRLLIPKMGIIDRRQSSLYSLMKKLNSPYLCLSSCSDVCMTVWADEVF